MSTEIVRPEPAELQQGNEPMSMMEVIARAAADPKVDVDKMRALLEMKFQAESRAAEVEFNAALARLMPKLPRIEKDGVIRDKHGAIRSKFARYEDIDLVIRPLLAEEGFSIAFDTDDSVPRMLRVVGTLSHRLGHSRKSQITVPTESAVITGAQAVGSAASFGKRYVVINLLNIITVGTDNDGQGDPEPITEDQALTITTLLKDTNANVPKFLEWMGAAKVGDILAKDFSKAVKALEAKKRQ